MRVRAEFTTEPFHGEGPIPEHVTAAAAPLAEAGLDPELGPLGTAVEGDADVVVDALAASLKAALRHGATRVTLTLGDVDQVRTPDQATDLTGGLSRLIGDVERELGGDLSGLPREEKQHAVRLLEERGAFEMRRSAETVAQALGLSRFTVYNYLNRIRESG